MPKTHNSSRAPSVRVHPYSLGAGLFFPGSPPPSGADEIDTADSRTRRIPCEEWKYRFDGFLDAYVTAIYTSYNTHPEKKREQIKASPLRDTVLVDVIKQTGFEKALSNILVDLLAQDEHQCLEGVLANHYVGTFRPAFNEFMAYPNIMKIETRCSKISLAIILRKLKDKLFGEFSFGKSRKSKRNENLKSLISLKNEIVYLRKLKC
jgi:hypothetical protein